MKNYIPQYVKALIVCVFLLCINLTLLNSASGQVGEQRRGRRGNVSATPTLGLDQGLIEFDTPDFNLKLVKASQTIAALEPKGAEGFDFTPADLLESRAGDGYYHLGDLNLRVRSEKSNEWKSYSTAATRKPVKVLETSDRTLAAADLSATLPVDCPLQVTRTWALDNDKLLLKFHLENKTTRQIEIGALGIPLIFNNYITRRSLEQAHTICSFSDPVIGLDAGYVQVTRLNGQGPALIVVADGKTPFETYRPLEACTLAIINKTRIILTHPHKAIKLNSTSPQ